MLRPLWESREHYEELKQMDDAMKEVKAVQRTQAGESGTRGQAVQRAGTRAKLSETRGLKKQSLFPEKGSAFLCWPMRASTQLCEPGERTTVHHSLYSVS